MFELIVNHFTRAMFKHYPTRRPERQMFRSNYHFFLLSVRFQLVTVFEDQFVSAICRRPNWSLPFVHEPASLVQFTLFHLLIRTSFDF